jgi:general secretion pathway protein B
MSYILDALKKAERERDLRQVPTIMTVHEPGVIRRNRLWAILSALVVCAGIAIWFIIPSLRTMLRPAPSQPGAGYNQSLNGPEAKQAGVSIPVDSSPASAPSAQPPAARKSELASEKSAESKITPRTEVAGIGRDASREKAVEIARRTSPLARSEAITQPGEEEEEEEDVPPAELIHIQTQLRSVGANPAAIGGKPDSKTSQTQPESLQEALGKMKLSLLYFSDTKAERTVFINGRKYVEGDYVEGIYLLESITLEGAILSYKDDRAILRPLSK